MGQWFLNLVSRYVPSVYIPHVTMIDIVEVLILTFLIYQVAAWIKNTKAWMLLRGIIVMGVFILIATILQMNTILYLVRNLVTVMAIGAVVVFQPEIRRGLEKLGERNFIPSFDTKNEVRFSTETIDCIVDACDQMGQAKTGALIVVEQAIQLTEYESTGIHLDALVSSQVLVNIFEHNTPLHDGAIIIRGDRIVSATCYLPLSDNMDLSKELGTRHRAAVGMSEVSDALVVVVSEETGAISVAEGGQLSRAVSREELTERLRAIQPKKKNGSGRHKVVRPGRRTKDEAKTDE